MEKAVASDKWRDSASGLWSVTSKSGGEAGRRKGEIV